MARYDLYLFNGGLVIDLQNDLIEIPGSRVVAPVIPMDEAPQRIKALHPILVHEDASYVVVTHLLAAAPKRFLKDPLGNHVACADELTRALDFLFQGY